MDEGTRLSRRECYWGMVGDDAGFGAGCEALWFSGGGIWIGLCDCMRAG